MILKREICSCCFKTAKLFPTKCKEKPELLINTPIGMYH